MRCIKPMRTVYGSMILACLTACSIAGTTSSPGPFSPTAEAAASAARFANVDPPAAQGFVIVSDDTNNNVFVFTKAGNLSTKITGFANPQGLAVDALGTLYVANSGASNILVYKSDYKTLEATLLDPKQFPEDVAVDQTGMVGVANSQTTSGGPGSVSLFTKGATNACATVHNAAWNHVLFGAFDDAGDFFVDGRSSSGKALVGVVKGGCSAKVITTLAVSNTISYPGGVKILPNDRIAITDQGGGAIYTYNAPVNGVLGKPVVTTQLTGARDTVSIAFTKNASGVWATDSASHAVYEYVYPAGGAPSKTISGFSQAVGIAVTPVEQP